MNKELGLIFFENPISRTFLHIAKTNDFKFKKIIVLQKKNLFPNFIYKKYNFNRMNSYPLNFLKKEKYNSIISKIGKYFGFNDNFYHSVFTDNKLEEYADKVEYLNTDDINSDIFIEKVLNNKELTFLNTGNKIYKKIFDFPITIVHIHPGYLPNIRGADASLWNIHKLNFLAATSFIMNQKIDTGKILNKTCYKIPIFKTNVLSKLTNIDLYRFWFSFVDPALRGKHFEEKILNYDNSKVDIGLKININDLSEYYSFMKIDNFRLTFEKVFKID
jgi:hypothetical protein